MKKTSLLLVLVGTLAACGQSKTTQNGGAGGAGGAAGAGAAGGAGGGAAPVDGSTDAPADGGADTTPDALPAFTVGGTIIGLTGSGLVLRDNGGDDLPVPAGATTFTFPTPLHVGDSYTISVAVQPTSPAQTCVVAGGSGVLAAANVASVAITCSTESFTLGGTIAGLTGTGLVLQNNGGDDLAIAPGASSFTFPVPLPSGAAFTVTVLTQPTSPSQVCSIEGGTGTVGAGGVTDIAITCVAKTFTVGGTISGLTGTGLVLQNNAGDNLTVSAGATTFTFPTPVDSGTAYAVTVLAQPKTPTQTCSVAAGTGTVGGADVTSVAITCSTKTFSVGGTISGLTGTGLVLRNNGGDDLAIPASATTFTFPTPLASGSAFAVTVAAQPTTPPQSCTVSGGTGTIGTAPVASVVINCSVDKFTIGGQITGLLGPVVLADGTESQTVTADGMFAFPTPIASGATYAVTVATQPSSPSQTCVVANGSGTVAGANVTNVTITCTTNSFHVHAVVTGLQGNNGVILRNNIEPVLVQMPGTIMFPTAVLSGASYAVVVAVQPTSPSQTCTLGAGAAGVMGGSDVTVMVTCVTNTYNVRVTVSGLSGSGLILQSGADSVPVSASSTFNMPTKVVSGTLYQVTVVQQPLSPSQTCVVTPAMPAVVGGADPAVSVSCMTNSFKVSGMITGLVGTGLVLQNNGANDTPVSAGATSFTFNAPVPSGGAYNVTVKTQPSGPLQTCTPTANMGNVGNGDVTTVVLTCTTNMYTVNAHVTGLMGTGLVLQDNGADDLGIVANDTTVPFATKLISGQMYAVTVLTQPSNPAQSCVVTAPSGAIVDADVTVAVICSSQSIGGTVVGLVDPGLVLRDNGADDLAVPMSDTTFTFATKITTGSPYAVTVAASPTNQFCQVTANGTGVASADVTNVSVDCAICVQELEGSTFNLACPAGQTIASFDFGSYGTPNGTCGNYSLGSCNSTMSAQTLAACVGQNSCSFVVGNTAFNGDPCVNTYKWLTVQARCH